MVRDATAHRAGKGHRPRMGPGGAPLSSGGGGGCTDPDSGDCEANRVSKITNYDFVVNNIIASSKKAIAFVHQCRVMFLRDLTDCNQQQSNIC